MGKELKPENKDGISQAERFLLSLNPDYFGIDEKDPHDLLKLLADLSGEFNYYNFSNEIDGDWKEFLTDDIDIIIALLSKQDSQTYRNEYKQLTDAVINAKNEPELFDNLNKIFRFIQSFIQVLLAYHQKFLKAGNLHQNQFFRFDTQLFTDYLASLEADKFIPEKTAGQDYFDLPVFEFLLRNEINPKNSFLNKSGTARAKALQVLPLLQNLFSKVNATYTHLLEKAGYYLKTQPLDGNVYEPHIALLVSFLHLYTYVQKPINALMQKHLDYYYQEIIGMPFRKEVPDKVHLVLEPVDRVLPFVLPQGEQIIAEIEGQQEKLLYQLAHDVQVSGAQIKELKTLFLSNKSPVKEDVTLTSSIHELQVYQGDYGVSQPADYLKNQDTTAAWPLLGEEQMDLPHNQKTMAAADIGLLVASPLFYQPDGHRVFSLKFYIQESDFSQFLAYTRDLAKALKRSYNIVFFELLHQSFNLSITSKTGWLNIADYEVTGPAADDPETFILIKFKLDLTAAAVGIYDSTLHGDNFGVEWPIVRFMLNNSSFLHPYTFLSYFQIERIGIKVEVKESKSFKLKNNLGELYSQSPFQPFGPVPAVGSFLDIQNTNIFNRYTQNFTLQIHWFDLPKEEGGFSTYYAGYPHPYTNESFKVTLNNSTAVNSGPLTYEQRAFNLFQSKTINGRNYLNTRTMLTASGFNRLKFDNGLGLNRETEGKTDYFTKGTVRLELMGPQPAFGHRLYPLIFTDTVVHNFRKPKKKLPVPNQPFIPVIKSLGVDYTLEHSEYMHGVSYAAEEEIELIHVYPFGYDKFYTGKNTKNNYFVRPTEQESNLFIGLDGLIAGQELSFLFQLSEKNFHNTLQEPQVVNWAYLVKNQWVPIPKAGILHDTTNNFVSSGIVTLQIPLDIARENTILNPDLYWLRASVPGESLVGSKVIAVFTQAVLATRMPGQDQFPASSYTLSPGSVKGFKGRILKIKEVNQFFPSFQGRPQESYSEYNIRVSERLRHKQRLLSVLDISQAILDAFPEILMVKCYNQDNPSQMVLPGVDVQVMVVPREQKNGTFTSEEPKVNLSVLLQIKKFISNTVSDFIKVEVGNPVYEKVMVIARVKFKSTDSVHHSNGYYIKLLNQDIKNYISPWLYQANGNFQIGKKVYVSKIFNYLLERPYISYITGFSLVHFYQTWNKKEKRFEARVIDTAEEKAASLQGSFPGAILIPAAEHAITILDEQLSQTAKKAGIGEFSIGSNLLINQPEATELAAYLPEPAEEELYDFTFLNSNP